MPRRNISRSDRARYYLAAANFWFEVVQLQKARCQQEEKSGVESRADLSFYVVAVQRLLEVARMTRDRLGIREIGQAIDEFDARWPKFRELRNLEEHILGPSLNSPMGFTYFGDFVGDLLPGGAVDYVIDVRDTRVIDRLHEKLCHLLAE